MARQSEIERRTAELVESKIDSMNLDLVGVEYVKEDGEWFLRIFIDKQGGVSLDDCSAASLAVEPILDEADILTAAYNLEISSPGIDRPLATDRDLNRNIGALVEVHPLKPDGKKKWFEGILASVSQEEIRIVLDEPFVKGVRPKTNGQEKSFLRREVGLIKKAIRF